MKRSGYLKSFGKMCIRDSLNNRLMDSVVPSEYLSISFVEKLIDYIDSGQVRSLSEGILLLNIETIQPVSYTHLDQGSFG